MGALEETISEITQEIKQLEEEYLGEVVFKHILLDVPELEDLLNPEPDVIEEEKLYDIRDNPSVLGVYIPMSSPGQVILFSLKIKRFFWSLIKRIHHRIPFITKFDLIAGARLVVLQTYHHEIFHFNCDVFRLLLGSSYDAATEEALAVAYSRMKIAEERQSWQAQIGRMNGVVYSLMIDEAFRYKSKGYKNWIYYADKSSFKRGLLDYIKHNNYKRLQSNRVSVEDILFELLGKPQGFVELVR